MNEFYSVKEIAKITGVSIRALHHYDKIDLLKPSVRTEARYRMYGKTELLRLQQILFYKEMDFSLEEIKDLLDDPDFDLVTALTEHKNALKEKQNRISTLILTIDKTINHLKRGGKMLTPEELYDGLSKETADHYRKIATEKYGKESVETSENYLRKLSKDQIKALQAEMSDINARLGLLMKEDPTSKAVQKEIANHYTMIRKFWGTHGSEDPQLEAYAGLGQLYVDDLRFTALNGNAQPEFALFMSKAMKYYSENR